MAGLLPLLRVLAVVAGILLICWYARSKKPMVVLTAGMLFFFAQFGEASVHAAVESLSPEMERTIRGGITIIWYYIAILAVILGVFHWLRFILCREWVKSDLRLKTCKPMSVRWRPFLTTLVTCAFEVVYSDFRGQIHRSIGRTYWWRRRVTWDCDEIIDHTHDAVG